MEDFNSKIVIPVTEKCNDNSDTAELFMRAYDLCTLTSNVKRKSKNSPTEPKISKIKSPFIKITKSDIIFPKFYVKLFSSIHAYQ